MNIFLDILEVLVPTFRISCDYRMQKYFKNCIGDSHWQFIYQMPTAVWAGATLGKSSTWVAETQPWCHHQCLPAHTFAGSWNWETQPGPEPRTLMWDAVVLTRSMLNASSPELWLQYSVWFLAISASNTGEVVRSEESQARLNIFPHTQHGSNKYRLLTISKRAAQWWTHIWEL